MKSIVHILMDGVGTFNIGATPTRNSPTPFLDKMMENCIFASNMQTQGPYTEAAWVSQLGGEKTLQHGGYLLGLNTVSKTLAESLNEKGYKTLSVSSFGVASNGSLRGIDEVIDVSTFSNAALKAYRLEYYRDIFLKGELNEFDIGICKRLLRDMFDAQCIQLSGIIDNSGRTKLLTPYYKFNEKYDFTAILEQVLCQKTEFEKSEKEYVEGLLEQWEKHPLFSIPLVDLPQKASLETKTMIRQEYTNIIEQWQDKCGELARKNIHLPIKYLINLFNSEDVDLRSRLGKIKAVAKTLGKLHRGNSLKDNALENYGKEKACVSAQSQLQFFEEKILEMDRENKKYYTYIHLEDFHLPSTFFTYDTDDLDLVRSELADGQAYIDGLPSNYDGNIESDLSVRYLDRKLEKFVNNILGTVKNEVVFVVTADHGNPFYHKPIRPNWRNVCYENFTIPFIMFGTGVPNIQCGRATSSVDIIPTILYYSGNEIGKDYTGQAIGLDNFVFKPVGAEYMGAGCPDYTRREICYSMMNENYKVGVKVLLMEDVTPQNIDEIYNLKKDNGLDVYNLYKKERGNPEVQQLLEEISKRHKEIQKALAVN